MENSKHQNQSYYAIDTDNEENTEYPFFVNCTGEVDIDHVFSGKSDRGRNDYYFMYIQSGTMDARLAETELTLSEGEYICIPPHTPYFYTNSRTQAPIIYYWLHFSGNDCRRLAEECGITFNLPTNVGSSKYTERCFEDIFSEFRTRQPNFIFSAALKAQYILLNISRIAASSAKNSTSASKLDVSIKYIHTHLKHKLSVEELAKMEYLSPSRYREVFKQITGLSPMDYITELRIRHACELIKQGDLSLSRISELCGYQDRLYFQRIFKKRVGCTPGKYSG